MTEKEFAPALVNQTLIDAPIETVWSTLVATDRPLPFFFGSVCDTKDGLVEGRKMRMVHPNGKFVMVVGEVLKFDPPNCYSHTFQMTNIDEPPCRVTYTLTESAGATKLELIIEHAIEGGKLFREMKGAQSFILSNLKRVAETGQPAFTGRMAGLLSPVFGLMAKKNQHIDRWPLD